MKKIATTIAIALFATVAFAQKMQEKDVPAPVKLAFQQKYPAAKVVKWDKEGNQYEASFDMNKADHSVLLDAQGSIVETEVEIKRTALPSAVLEYVKKQYAGKKITEGAKITDAHGVVTYEVEIKGKDLIFSSDGQFVKEVKA